MPVEINPDSPRDAAQWNELCAANGNLLQSTHYDAVQAFYRQQPVYFELWQGNQLRAGVKLYGWSSRKLGPLTAAISKSAMQFGELVVQGGDPDGDAPWLQAATAELGAAVNDYIEREKVVSASVSGYYGGEGLLIEMSAAALQKKRIFEVATVDLEPPKEQMWASLHQMHRRNIKKAEKNQLVCRGGTFDEFAELLQKTYEATPEKQPNLEFIRHSHERLEKQGFSEIYVAQQGEQLLASVLINRFGKTAYYSFGGNRRNNVGAGHLLHWETLRNLKEAGLTRYILGQVAPEIDPDNEKFSVGISSFKRGFGTSDILSGSSDYIFRKGRNKLWQNLKKAAPNPREIPR